MFMYFKMLDKEGVKLNIFPFKIIYPSLNLIRGNAAPWNSILICLYLLNPNQSQREK